MGHVMLLRGAAITLWLMASWAFGHGQALAQQVPVQPACTVAAFETQPEATVAACTAVVRWQGADNVLSGAMTVGSLTVFLAYLTRFFKPVEDLAKMTNAVAQTHVALERIADILDVDMTVLERPDGPRSNPSA